MGYFQDADHLYSTISELFVRSACTAHLFWLEKVNLAKAILSGQIKIERGKLSQVLKLLSAIKPLYSRYRTPLQEGGDHYLLV